MNRTALTALLEEIDFCESQVRYYRHVNVAGHCEQYKNAVQQLLSSYTDKLAQAKSQLAMYSEAEIQAASQPDFFTL